MLRCLLVALLAMTTLTSWPVAGAAQMSLSESCPSYQSSLATAEAFLAEGDREHALDALLRAREILSDCIRRAAGETAVVAVSRPPREG